MTYALRETRSLALHALAAPTAREIALIALTALGLSKDPFHEPFHARGLYATQSCSPYVTSPVTVHQAPMSVPGRHRGRRLPGHCHPYWTCRHAIDRPDPVPAAHHKIPRTKTP
jgi:hypothetical protein